MYDNKQTIGKRIKYCRELIGFTQEQLAEMLYVSKSIISAWENDRVDLKISMIKEIADKLHTSVSYLVEGKVAHFDSDVTQIAELLQQIKNEKLRKVAIEQVKALLELPWY